MILDISPLPKFVYHYTRLKTLIHILDFSQLGSDCNKDASALKLTFHATDIDALNDRTEYINFHDLIKKMKPLNVEERFSTAVNGTPYVVSFSEKADYLPMWRLYADDCRGVCLKFNVQKLLASIPSTETQKPYHYLLFNQCRYKCDKELIEMSQSVSNRFSKTNESTAQYFKWLEQFIDFQLLCSLFKDSSFEYEGEWRLVLMSPTCSFKENTDGIVAYTPFEIPITCLEEISIGCNCNITEETMIRKYILPYNQFAETPIIVTKSNLPYRN